MEQRTLQPSNWSSTLVPSSITVLLIRILNLSQIGEVSLLAAASAGFTTITQLALPLAATRFISATGGSKDPSTAGSVARTSLRLTITIAAPTLLLSVLASPWIASTVFKNSDATSFLIVAFAASFLLDLTALYGAYFLPVLIIVFGLSFLIVSRELSVFTTADFELLENALPTVLKPCLDKMERLLARGKADPRRSI